MIDRSETDHMFKALMDASDFLLSINNIIEVNVWFDAGEYGMALETLVDILSEGSVPSEIIQRVKVLAIHMGMTELSLANLVEVQPC